MKIQSVRGMQDVLPPQQAALRRMEDICRQTLAAYGYQEIGIPCIESAPLFSRLVGETTDIVEKEMFTFADRGGDSLSLRPEGTAGCVRYALQHGLIHNQVQRFWYAGPMFRYERPQKGRYRQFQQLGVECFGIASPDIDAELLLLCRRLWQALGLSGLALEINSLGSSDARARYREALVQHLSPHRQELDEDSQRRLATNPLRILDSKAERTQALLADAPSLHDFLDDGSRADFDALQGYLDDYGLAYTVNPRIVRGLDYYNGAVFEWSSPALGAQNALCGGGRYDGLVELLGGRPTPGVGFALGLDRLALLLDAAPGQAADIYLASQGAGARRRALALGEGLRDRLPDRKVLVHCGEGKLKAQMKKADASGAALAVIIGEAELEAGTASVKCLRRAPSAGGDRSSEDGGAQTEVQQSGLAEHCAAHLEGG